MRAPDAGTGPDIRCNFECRGASAALQVDPGVIRRLAAVPLEADHMGCGDSIGIVGLAEAPVGAVPNPWSWDTNAALVPRRSQVLRARRLKRNGRRAPRAEHGQLQSGEVRSAVERALAHRQFCAAVMKFIPLRMRGKKPWIERFPIATPRIALRGERRRRPISTDRRRHLVSSWASALYSKAVNDE